MSTRRRMSLDVAPAAASAGMRRLSCDDARPPGGLGLALASRPHGVAAGRASSDAVWKRRSSSSVGFRGPDGALSPRHGPDAIGRARSRRIVSAARAMRSPWVVRDAAKAPRNVCGETPERILETYRKTMRAAVAHSLLLLVRGAATASALLLPYHCRARRVRRQDLPATKLRRLGARPRPQSTGVSVRPLRCVGDARLGRLALRPRSPALSSSSRCFPTPSAPRPCWGESLRSALRLSSTSSDGGGSEAGGVSTDLYRHREDEDAPRRALDDDAAAAGGGGPSLRRGGGPPRRTGSRKGRK